MRCGPGVERSCRPQVSWQATRGRRLVAGDRRKQNHGVRGHVSAEHPTNARPLNPPPPLPPRSPPTLTAKSRSTSKAVSAGRDRARGTPRSGLLAPHLNLPAFPVQSVACFTSIRPRAPRDWSLWGLVKNHHSDDHHAESTGFQIHPGLQAVPGGAGWQRRSERQRWKLLRAAPGFLT